MKILLLGANGQVGHELRRSLAPLGELIVSTRDGLLQDGTRCEVLDLAKLDSIPETLRRLAPDVVVNAAAYTAVDRAEDETDAAFLINATAPQYLADACANQDALFVHYSTDYVFDGRSETPYREQDTTHPPNVYGASKLQGETAVVESVCRHMVFRTGWVYGNHGNNFMRTMLRLAAEGRPLRVVADQYGAPTPAALIADATAHALQSDNTMSGMWHLSTTGVTSWHGFAAEIFRQLREDDPAGIDVEIVPLTTSEYPTRARRPAYSCLDSARMRADFNLDLPDWRIALQRVIGSIPA